MTEKDSKEAEKVFKVVAMTSDEMVKQRDLQKEMNQLLKKTGGLHEDSSENIQTQLKKMTKVEVVTRQIQNLDIERMSLSKGAAQQEGIRQSKLKEILDLEHKIKEGILNKHDLEKSLSDLNGKKLKDTKKSIKAQEELLESFNKELEVAKGIQYAAEKSRDDTESMRNGHLAIIAAKKKELELAEKEELHTKVISSLKEKFLGGYFEKFAKSDLSKALGLDKVITKMSGPVKLAFEVVFKLIAHAWKTFKLFDEDVFRLRKNLGLMGKQGSEVQRTARLIAREYASIGVTITQSVDSLTSLSKAFGSVSSLTEEMVATTAAFSAQLGISEDISANVQKNMAQISGKNITDATEGMMGLAQSMSVAAEVPLPEVMNDLANISDSVRTTFRGNTMELIKATVEARRMGLSIESLGKTSEGLLEFNTSVNAEMEASVLLGKNINFIEARRKAFAGDILGANKEILKTLKSVGDFDKLNMFQKKALAQATGKTVEELQNMLQREKNIELIRKKGSGAAYDSLMLYEKQMKLKENESKDLGKAAEADILKMANQARMNVLMQQFQQMMMDLAGPVMDLMEPLMRIAVKILPTITAILSVGIAGAFARVFLYSGKLATSLGGSMIKWIGTLGRAGAFVARIGLGFARLFPPIAIVVGIVSALYGIFKEISLKSGEISKLWSEGKWWQSILIGIKAVSVGIIKGLLGPFEWVFDWIADNLGGKSPSKIGMMIVKGIESIGTMLLDALMYPFKSAYTFITELFGKIPEFISSVFKRGIDFAMKLPGMGLLMKVVDKLSGTVSTTSTPVENKNPTNSKDTDQLVLAKLTELVDLMRAGGIVINLDGRKVSEALAHASR